MQLHLAREPCLSIPGGELHPLAPLDAAMLAWLALEGPTPRARLAQLLWPDKDSEAARNSLRQRLFKLRRQLGVELVVGAGTALALADGVAHDLDEADEVLGHTAAESLAAGEFAAWLGQQRRRRGERVRHALAELAAMAETAGDFGDALDHARELLALDPLSEEAHRRLMRLHYLAGDRAAALRAFDDCERVLKHEVGARPAAETLALLATIEAADRPATAVAPVTPVPASVLRPPRLVGRERELAALQAAVRAGPVAALIGEAGLGKSRLLHELLAGCGATAYAAGRPGDAGVPFATLARLLRASVLPAGAAPLLPPATRSEIARVLPEFDSGSSAALRGAGEAQRLVLARAVHALLASLRLDVVALDDLHFADEASLEMLALLLDGDEATDGAPEGGAAEGPPRMHWVLAWRPAESGSPLRALHDALVERARLAAVPIGPLPEAALAELVDSLGLPGIHGRALAPGLLRRTGGNPLFVLETLKQAWVERSLERLADAAQLPTPLSVGRLIERRVAQLSPAAVALARVASIAGVDFSVGLAEQVLQAPAMQFADALNELEGAQVLRGAAFAHDLVHETVRAGVPPLVAAHTHARVAEWLEAHDGEPARIARHWIDAAQPRFALPWLGKAAAAAEAALRPREQLRFLDEKSRIEEQAQDRAAAFATAMTALELFGSNPDGETDLEARCSRLERLAATDAQRALVRIGRSEALNQRGDFEGARACAQEALGLVGPLAEPALTARMRRVLGEACVQTDRLGEAVQHLEAALPWHDAHADDHMRALLHGALATVYDNTGRLGDAQVHHEAALALMRRQGDCSNLAIASGNFACNRIDAGDLQAADAALAQDLQLLAAHDGEHVHWGTLHTIRALVLLPLGRYADALRAAEAAVEAFERVGSGLLARSRQRLAWVWWQLAQQARALQELERAEAAGAHVSLPGSVTQAWLRWAVARETGAAPRGSSPERLALDALMAGLDAGWRPDLQLGLRIETAAADAADATDAADAADARRALVTLDAVRAEAERIGHGNTVLAARLRAAEAACRVDPERARAEALAALELRARGLQTTVVAPGAQWLCLGQALAHGGLRAQAVAQVDDGVAWLRATASRHVPEAFRDGFLHRHPAHRELLALAARLAAD